VVDAQKKLRVAMCDYLAVLVQVLVVAAWHSWWVATPLALYRVAVR
jgi:hypothetical protein